MLKSLTITGGRPLGGAVNISGSKNVVQKTMIASLLTDEPVTIHNAPHIGDVDITAQLCRALGAEVSIENSTLQLHTPQITNATIEHQAEANRASILAVSPLLVRVGEARLPAVGGDQIGPRPVNYHLAALHQMGANIHESADGYRATATRLRGATIHLPYPSVGATENIVLAAVLAEGRTYINNAAIEPEVVDLIKMLQQMGAIIEFRANRNIIIDGVERLHGVSFSIIPDRLEAASFACAAVASGGEILVQGARQDDMITFLNTIRRVGGDYEVRAGGISFKRVGELRGIELETDTFPGFATDWQQPLVVLLTQAVGLSVVHETVYENRFAYTQTLNAMGAEIGVFSKCLGEISCRFRGRGWKHSAVIKGPTQLRGTEIEIPDIRAGIAQVIAALIAQGPSHLTGVNHLIRGYGEGLLDKLRSIGAEFKTGD